MQFKFKLNRFSNYKDAFWRILFLQLLTYKSPDGVWLAQARCWARSRWARRCEVAFSSRFDWSVTCTKGQLLQGKQKMKSKNYYIEY